MAQVMACCLTAPSHYPNQCSVGKKLAWFIRHLSDGLYIFHINLWNLPSDIWAYIYSHRKCPMCPMFFIRGGGVHRCFASSPKYSLEICVLRKSYNFLCWEFQAQNLYLCSKPCFGQTYKVSAWNSHHKCDFWCCIFLRDDFGELTKRWWNSPQIHVTIWCHYIHLATTS